MVEGIGLFVIAMVLLTLVTMMVHDESFANEEYRSIVDKLEGAVYKGSNTFEFHFKNRTETLVYNSGGALVSGELYNLTYARGNYWWPFDEDNVWKINKVEVLNGG